MMDVQNLDSFWIWIALFSLGAVGIIILFFSSRQMMAIKKQHRVILDKQLDAEQKQALFFANMGENMHSIIEEKLKSTSSCKPTDEESMRREKLFDASSTLIDFLRLKSKKVTIANEAFNLNNVLNEVSGSVSSAFRGSRVELIFDIEHSVPRYLIGDSLKLEKILNGLFEYTLTHITKGEVKLAISAFESSSESIELQFRLTDTGRGMNREAVETLFVPHYDEKNNEYTGIGLYVVKELITIMHGEIAVESEVGKGTSFIVSLPLEMEDSANRRKYRLSEKLQTPKKILIVDGSYNAALAIKKMFSYFKYSVKVVSKEKFIRSKYDFSLYDIVILDERLLTDDIVASLAKIRSEQMLKVIALNSQLQEDEQGKLHEVIDRRMLKPLNQERIFELTTDIYFGKEETIVLQKKQIDQPKHIATYRSEIEETRDIAQEHFSDFRGMRLLIVEDNRVNQKVLANILKNSGVEITIANNGEEAVVKLRKNVNGYDLVLMDINMPVMDGFTATETIRSECQFDRLPIVAFTALALESEKQKVFNCGMNAFLCKPLNIGKLYTVFKMFAGDRPEERVSLQQHKAVSVEKKILDTATGIKNASGNVAFYMEILAEFTDAYGQSSQQFAILSKEKNFSALEKLCLDMKGLTGTIGAKEMHSFMVEIHQLVIESDEAALQPDYSGKYKKQLNRLLGAIETYISQ